MNRFLLYCRLAIICIVFLIGSNNVSGIGADPNPQIIRQPDGSVLTVHIHGDEWFNWVATADGYRIIRNKQGVFEYAAVLKSGEVVPSGIKVSNVLNRNNDENNFLQTVSKGSRVSGEIIQNIRNERRTGVLKSGTVSTYFPTKGQHKLLVILANFSDTNPLHNQDAFDRYMNEVGYEGTGSFKDYYIENSLGQLEVTSLVTEWVTLPKNHDYYGPREVWGEFAYEAIKAASNQGVDMSQFDNDGDGIVEGIAIIHQGPGQEVTSNELDIWSHSWSLASAGYSQIARTFNGVLVNQYTTQPETRNTTGTINTIGVMCHEFGHNLGAADYYDTDAEENGTYQGTGRWDLMASGSYNGSPSGSTPSHHNPYNKILYNWTSATLISQPQTLALEPVISSGKIYRLNSPVTNEYILIENRQKIGFDVSLPGKGLLAYHADGNWIDDNSKENIINTTIHQGFYPIAAGGSINTASCPFPGSSANLELTDVSTPAMKTWSGEGFNRSITGITEVEDVVYFDFMAFQNGSPLALSVNAVGPTTLQIDWEPSVVSNSTLLAWSESGIFGTPENSVNYNIGDTIAGGGSVIYSAALDTLFLHEGLQPSTKYYYAIWSRKDTIWTSPLKASGTTETLPINTFPWFDGFENGLDQWNQEFVSGDYAWALRTEGNASKPVSAFEGYNFALFYASTLSKPVTRLISPVIELDGTSDYVLEFRHYQAEWDLDQDELKVLIKPESSAIWEELAVFSEDEPEWIQRRIGLPYSEPAKIAFEGFGNWGYGIAVDSVVIKQIPDCSLTGNLESLANITDTTFTGMTLAWNRQNGDGTLVVARKGNKVIDLPQYGQAYLPSTVFGAGDSLGVDTYVVYSGTGNSVELTGMDHSSNYHFAFFAYSNSGLCYQAEPERYVFATEMKIHTINVVVTDGVLPLVGARVMLAGELQITNENGIATYLVSHRDESVSISVSFDGKQTSWSKLLINDSQSVNVELDTIIPIVPTEITHDKDYKTLTLKWNPVIDDNFDNYDAFATTIPGWTYIDNDKKQTYGFDGYDFPNNGYIGSYIVLDAHSEYLLQAGNGTNAYSGRQVLACFAAVGAQNDDWIISPTFTVQTDDQISFMARSYTSEYGLEKFNVLVSVQEPSPQNFVQISGATKEAPVIWTPFTFSLNQYAGKVVRVAIQCVSDDAFVFLLDGIKVGPLSKIITPSLVQNGDSAEPLLMKKFEVNFSADHNTKHEMKLIDGQITPDVGPIGYIVMLDDQVAGSIDGFYQTSLIAEVPECAGNAFKLKTNYLVEGETSAWVDYVADGCYSVLFTVKDSWLDPIPDAEITFAGRTQTTDVDGITLFTGLESATGLIYSILKEEFENFDGSMDLASADQEINITLTSTSINDLLLNGAEINYYPNPARSEVIITGVLPGNLEVQLYDFGGTLIRSIKTNGGTEVIFDLMDVNSGIYLIVLRQESDVWQSKLVVMP
jgi:M6 family metalloprotease-like protein